MIVMIDGKNSLVIVTCVKRSIKIVKDYFSNWASLEVNFSINNRIFRLTFFLSDFVLSFNSYDEDFS